MSFIQNARALEGSVALSFISREGKTMLLCCLKYTNGIDSWLGEGGKFSPVFGKGNGLDV